MTQGGGSRDSAITDVIAEFSEILASSRSRWTRTAESIRPDLPGTTTLVLQVAVRRGPISASEISSFLGMDKAMLSRHVSRLRELGLLQATPDPEDGRVIRLSANAEARAIIQAIRAEWARGYHDRFANWSVDEIRDLRSALHRFNEAAEPPFELAP